MAYEFSCKCGIRSGTCTNCGSITVTPEHCEALAAARAEIERLKADQPTLEWLRSGYRRRQAVSSRVSVPMANPMSDKLSVPGDVYLAALQRAEKAEAELAALRAQSEAQQKEIERLERRCEEIDDEKTYAEERLAAEWEAGRAAGIETSRRPLADFQKRAESAEQELAALRAQSEQLHDKLREDAREYAALYMKSEAAVRLAENVPAWLRAYAEKMSGSHQANAGYIALHAAASLWEEERAARASKPRETP